MSKRKAEEGEGKGLILPYRRLGGDISSPNLEEGTCREASRTYRGKSCGRFPDGSRDEDSPGEEGLKVLGGITSSQKVVKKKNRGEDGSEGKGGKDRNRY